MENKTPLGYSGLVFPYSSILNTSPEVGRDSFSLPMYLLSQCFYVERNVCFISWPLLIPKYHIRHILDFAFMIILKLIIQLTTTLGFENCSLPPISFFSVNLISVLGLHSPLRKQCYHAQDGTLYDWPQNALLIGSLQSFRSLTVSGSYCLVIMEIPRALCSSGIITNILDRRKTSKRWASFLKHLHLFSFFKKKQTTPDYYLS